jgi:hypothetical protein
MIGLNEKIRQLPLSVDPVYGPPSFSEFKLL